jgi:hypothetical protein
MGAETQVLDFIFKLQVGPFRKSADALTRSFDRLEDKVQGAFKKGFVKMGGLAAKGISVLTKVLELSFDEWSKHTMMMEKYRKEASLTKQEAGDFSMQVISASARYGVALTRVGMIATSISKGLGKSRGEAVKLAAAMGDLGDVTGMTDETAVSLSETFFRQFNLSATDSSKSIHGLAEMAREAHMPMEEMGNIIGRNAEALRVLPIKEAAKQLGALAATMREQGASVEQIDGVVAKFGDTNSRLYKTFIGLGKSVPKTIDFMGQKVKFLREQFQKGAIDHTQYEVNLSRLGQQYDLSRFQLEKMADSVGGLEGKMKSFDEVDKLSAEELQKRNESRATSFTKFGKRLESLKSGFAKYFDSLWGPNAAIWGALDQWMDKISDVADAVDKFWQGFMGHLSEGLKAWTSFIKGFEAADLLDPFQSRKLKGESAHLGDTPEEQVAFYSKKFDTIANTMAARGVDKETVNRYRSERSQDLDRIKENIAAGRAPMAAAERSIPSSAAPSPGASSGVAAEGVKATEGTNKRLDRLIGIQEEQLRQNREESLRSSSTPGGNRALAASKAVTQ